MRANLYRWLHRRFGRSDVLADRRAFLRASLAATAGLYLSGCTGFQRQPPAVSDRPRVIVVGAGFAGLACAFELHGAGWDVVILEARKRPGGRVHTLTDLVPGRTVEAGGSLIGANHATWLTYAERFGLELLDVVDEPADRSIPMVLDGERLSPRRAEALYESLTRFETAMAEASAVVTDPARPWTATDAPALDQRSLGAWIDGLELAPEPRVLVEVLESNNNVRATAEQSLLAMLAAVAGGGGEAYFTESEVYRCRGGNGRLVKSLAEALGERLRLDTPVERLAWDEGGVTVVTAAGETLEADHGVLATPPSTWDRIRFEPALPSDLAPSLGPAVKVLAPVDGPFWEAEGWSQYGLGDGAVAMTWDGTYRQADGGPACLVGFSGGPAAADCLAVPRAERQGFFDRQLSAFFPAFSKHRAAAPAFVRWPEDPWTRTGYSSPAPGEVTRVGPRQEAGAGRLRLAGEHTSWGFFGFMEGALSSGARLARRLAELEGMAERRAA